MKQLLPSYRELRRATPFLKWAGGKTQLLNQFEQFFPPKEHIKEYLEPFVGSAALFFHLQPERAHLADNNEELINCYKQVQRNVQAVIELLRTHKRFHSARHYYKVRAFHPKDLSPAERAARLIYLNKTCYNGLYRVNSRGQFNVPIGRYANPPILDEALLQSASRVLRGVGLHCMPFDRFCVEFAERGDFVYFDPPYVPLSKTSNFTSYTKDTFTLEDQQHLRDIFIALDRRGCLLMLSNSASTLVRNLYKSCGATTFEVSARRAINSAAGKRKAIPELVILNYDPHSYR